MRETLSRDHACLETRRIGFDGVDHQVGDGFTVLLPCRAVCKLRAHVLTEEACHMRTRRREAIVKGGRNYNFNNGRSTPATFDAIAIGLLQVRKAGRENYSCSVMIAGSRQRGKIRKF